MVNSIHTIYEFVYMKECRKTFMPVPKEHLAKEETKTLVSNLLKVCGSLK